MQFCLGALLSSSYSSLSLFLSFSQFFVLFAMLKWNLQNNALQKDLFASSLTRISVVLIEFCWRIGRFIILPWNVHQCCRHQAGNNVGKGAEWFVLNLKIIFGWQLTAVCWKNNSDLHFYSDEVCILPGISPQRSPSPEIWSCTSWSCRGTSWITIWGAIKSSN